MLSLVDYATRYPEAVPLSSIDTKSVAEALVSIFSPVGIPSKILKDMGTQFTSSVTKEVSGCFSFKPLSGATSVCANSIIEMSSEWSSGQIMNGLIGIPLRSGIHGSSKMFMKMRQLGEGKPEVKLSER